MHTHLEQERICGDVFRVKMNQSIRNPETLSTPNINIKRENKQKKSFSGFNTEKKNSTEQNRTQNNRENNRLDRLWAQKSSAPRGKEN